MLDAVDWEPVAKAAEVELTAVAKDGAQRALVAIGVETDESITSQTFTGAVEWAKARAAELVGKRWNDDGELEDNPKADMAITDTLRDEIRDAVAQALEDGDSAAELADTIEGLGAFSEERAMMIARTECLLGDTQVDAAVVRAAFRRRYDGDVVEIVTAGGRKLTATPNHPMLTRRGWVPAGELTDFDDLVCDRRQKNLGARGDQDKDGRPATIAQIFGALADARAIERYTGSRLEFHGDGMNGDVDTVRVDRELPIGKFAEIRKPLAHDVFSESDQTRAAFCHTCGRLLTVDKQPCFCRRAQRDTRHVQPIFDGVAIDSESGAEIDQGSAGHVSAGYVVDRETLSKGRRHEPGVVFCASSGLNVSHHAGPSQHESRSVQSNAEFKCHRSGAHAGRVETDGAVVVDQLIAFGQGGLAPCPEHASVNERFLQPRRIDSQLLGDEMEWDTGFIESDRLIAIKRFAFCGHVYNLETTLGYFCVAGGAYTGNTIRANANGQMAAMRGSGVVTQKAWSTAEDETTCDECDGNAEDGPIDLDATFSGGEDCPPQHPGCRCSVTAYVSDDEGESEEDDEDTADEAAE